MRLRGGVAGKGHFYDRSIDFNVLEYEGSDIAPHVRTLRDTYEVPTGKIIKLDMISLDMIRTSTTGTAVEALLELDCTKAIGGDFNLHHAVLYGKLIGEEADHSHDSNLFLGVGDVINLYTTDPSSGGTITYNGQVVFQIFNL